MACFKVHFVLVVMIAYSFLKLFPMNVKLVVFNSISLFVLIHGSLRSFYVWLVLYFIPPSLFPRKKQNVQCVIASCNVFLE